jgi:hypothetical protein
MRRANKVQATWPRLISSMTNESGYCFRYRQYGKKNDDAPFRLRASLM